MLVSQDESLSRSLRNKAPWCDHARRAAPWQVNWQPCGCQMRRVKRCATWSGQAPPWSWRPVV